MAIRPAAAILAVWLLFGPSALAQATLDEARAYVKVALAEIPERIAGYDFNDRPAGWNEMILDEGQETIEETILTPYGTYLIAAACDQDCISMGLEVYDNFGRSQGSAHGSARVAVSFNGGGLMRFRIWINGCAQPQCYLAYNVIQLD